MNYEKNSMTKTYFFDSYALFEILKGNKNYEPYTQSNIILTKLNLFEIYYGLLRDLNEEIASTILEKYSEFAIDFDKDTIEHAAQLRLRHRKQDLSMTDCIGYVLAQKLGIKFLTGDKEFQNLENVEFVK